MSDQSPTEPPTSDPPTPLFNLGPGLMEYYSSQAALMLAQYDNINRLLGPTDDWTHPGDFCEILFRDFLRKFLPPSLSADKGFFYGRAALEGDDTHCPEIDIIVHDTQQYRPIFRMGDFVIVQPQAVRGMIQVKRTFSQGQVRKGLKNIVCAKQHLLNVLWKDNPRGWGNSGMPPQVFTAVVGFKDEIGRKTSFYRKHLLSWSIKQRAYDRPNMQETNMYVLPSFIASLTRLFMMKNGPYWNHHYHVFNSIHKSANVCIQALLFTIYNELSRGLEERPPFAFPLEMKPFAAFHVLRIIKAEFNADGTITIYRNDKRRGHYRKADGATGQVVHLICDASLSLKVTDDLRGQLTPDELFVKCASGIERYEKFKWEVVTERDHRIVKC